MFDHAPIKRSRLGPAAVSAIVHIALIAGLLTARFTPIGQLVSRQMVLLVAPTREVIEPSRPVNKPAPPLRRYRLPELSRASPQKALEAPTLLPPEAATTVARQASELGLPVVSNVEPPPAPFQTAMALRPTDTKPLPKLVLGTFSDDGPREAPRERKSEVAVGSFSSSEGVATHRLQPRSDPGARFEDAVSGQQALGKRNGTSVGAFGEAGRGDSAVRQNNAVRVAGFAEMVAVTRRPAEARDLPRPSRRPVEILFKPRPGYTEQARRLQIEGEVVVLALFQANGSIRVDRVLRGLGYGLDEKALDATAGIRFRPAEEDGQPVDATASVRIVFQIAQ